MESSAQSNDQNYEADALRAEFSILVESDTFRNADRQKELLTYLVNATLEGRADDLAGKVIAENVFGIDIRSIRDVSTVRVEIGRLRRRLRGYYEKEGRNNPGRIDIPKGGYAVRFAAPPKAELSRNSKTQFNWSIVIVVATIAVAAGVVLVAASRWLPSPEPSISTDVIHPRFTESAEAYSLFFESRDIGNPPTTKSRVLAAIELTHEIQLLDSDFGGGYAAESIQLWNYILFGHSRNPVEDSKRALALAKKAVQIDPEFSWSQHALSQALHLNRDLAGAIEAARRAIDLNPNEPDHHGYLGLFTALSGQTSGSIAHIQKALELRNSVRTPYRNMLGIAYFHGRNFAAAAEIISQNRDTGGPSGPHMLVFLAVAHALAGHKGRAQAISELLRQDTTGFVPMEFIDRLYEAPSERKLLMDGLAKASLTEESLQLRSE